MKSSVLLVNPCSHTRNDIALGYIAAYVAKLGARATIIDFARDRPSLSGFLEILNRERPLLLGIAAYNESMHQVLCLAKLAKELLGSHILLGGPQVPAMPGSALLEMPNIDYLCRGEGEIVTSELLLRLDRGDPVDTVPGIAFRNSLGTIAERPWPTLPDDLDSYPSPYLEGIIAVSPHERALLLTSRGCSFSCRFCVTPFLSQRRVRYHSISRVIEEVRWLYGKGVRSFWIADPLFSVNRKRCLELFDAIAKLGLSLDFWCETRADLLDAQMLSAMKLAGVSKIAMGLESADNQALARMGKGQTLDGFSATVDAIFKEGIQVEFLHMMGNAGDSEPSILSTFDFIRSKGLFFNGNNTGNWNQLYFGSPDTTDPAHSGIRLKPVVQRGSWPKYLSPGSLIEIPHMTNREKRRVERRRISELFLAQMRDCHIKQKESWGLNARASFALPWPEIRNMRRIYQSERRSCSSDSTGYSMITVLQDLPGAAWVQTLGNALKNASFTCTISLILRFPEADYFSELAAIIRQQFKNWEPFTKLEIVVGLSPSRWVEQELPFAIFSRAVSRMPLDKPAFSAEPFRKPRVSTAAVANLSRAILLDEGLLDEGLLDEGLLDEGLLDGGQPPEPQAALSSESLFPSRALPLIVGSHAMPGKIEDRLAYWRSITPETRMLGAEGACLVFGSDSYYRNAELLSTQQSDLPVLHLVEKGTLYRGAYLSPIEDRAPSLWIRSDGSSVKSRSEFFEPGISSFASERRLPQI
jgi:anaerobic magnesium-protoporphyrin IX monomethyl ester cyclase